MRLYIISEHFTQLIVMMSGCCLQVPDVMVAQGQHRLTVEGLVYGMGDVGVPVFRNDTNLTFSPKYISFFIQTDKAIYMQETYGEYYG